MSTKQRRSNPSTKTPQPAPNRWEAAVERARRSAGESTALAAHDDELRRARTRLLVQPSIVALTYYRDTVLEHLNRAIANLEGLEAWAHGAEPADLPDDVARTLEITSAAHEHEDAAAMDEFLCMHAGPVQLAEAAIEVCFRQAAGDPNQDVQQGAYTLAVAAYESAPSRQWDDQDLERVLLDSLRAHGFDVTDYRDAFQLGLRSDSGSSGSQHPQRAEQGAGHA